MDDCQPSPALTSRVEQLDHAVTAMREAPDYTKATKLRRVLDALRRVLTQDGGPAAIRDRAQTLEASGVFSGTDWDDPAILVAALAGPSLHSENVDTVVLESASELRLAAIAQGDYEHADLTADDARRFLSQVLAINLDLLLAAPSEAERVQQGKSAAMIREVVAYIVEQIGYATVLDELGDEIWRILRQRPIQVDHVKAMVTRIAIARNDPRTEHNAAGGQGLDRLTTALFGPTEACREDPGTDVYLSRIEAMDAEALESESRGFARAMHDTGLVSGYHAVLVTYLAETNVYLLPEVLGVSEVGRNCMLRYADLVQELIRRTVSPQNAQCLYGLALLLDRGILHQPPVVPSLWRQLALTLAPRVRERLQSAFGPAVEPESLLIGGLLAMLGQPLGVGQGDNPTCQSARALSMWAYNDPDYLLQVVAWAARDDDVVAHFEGQSISSSELVTG
ncbi:MAG: hypothetical protein ACTIMF_19050, partial [Gordonia sp. (in: high G+C Gram-positive bacteria)]